MPCQLTKFLIGEYSYTNIHSPVSFLLAGKAPFFVQIKAFFHAPSVRQHLRGFPLCGGLQSHIKACFLMNPCASIQVFAMINHYHECRVACLKRMAFMQHSFSTLPDNPPIPASSCVLLQTVWRGYRQPQQNF